MEDARSPGRKHGHRLPYISGPPRPIVGCAQREELPLVPPLRTHSLPPFEKITGCPCPWLLLLSLPSGPRGRATRLAAPQRLSEAPRSREAHTLRPRSCVRWKRHRKELASAVHWDQGNVSQTTDQPLCRPTPGRGLSGSRASLSRDVKLSCQELRQMASPGWLDQACTPCAHCRFLAHLPSVFLEGQGICHRTCH